MVETRRACSRARTGSASVGMRGAVLDDALGWAGARRRVYARFRPRGAVRSAEGDDRRGSGREGSGPGALALGSRVAAVEFPDTQ